MKMSCANFVKLVSFSALLMIVTQKDASAEELIVALSENFPPFYYLDKDNEFKGASIEITQAISEKLGYSIVVNQYPTMREALKELEDGGADIIVNLSPTNEREEYAYFTSTPHIYESQDLIVRADSSISYNGSLLQLSTYRIGTIFGWTYGPQFDRANYLQKEYVTDSRQQMAGLLAGSFDIAINNRQFFMALSTETGMNSAYKVIEPSIYKLPVKIAVSKKHPNARQLAAELEQGVKEFIVTEDYMTLLRKYGFSSQSKPGREK